MGAFLRLAIIAVGSPEILRRNFWFFWLVREESGVGVVECYICLWENEKARRVFLDLVCTWYFQYLCGVILWLNQKERMIAERVEGKVCIKQIPGVLRYPNFDDVFRIFWNWGRFYWCWPDFFWFSMNTRSMDIFRGNFFVIFGILVIFSVV